MAGEVCADPESSHRPPCADTVHNGAGSAYTTLKAHRASSQRHKPGMAGAASVPEVRVGREVCESLRHDGTSWFGLGLQRVTCLQKSSFPAPSAHLQFLLTRPCVCLPAYIPSTNKKLVSSMFTHAQRLQVWKDKHQIADNGFLGGEIKTIPGPSFCVSTSSLTEEDILLEFKQTNSFL